MTDLSKLDRRQFIVNAMVLGGGMALSVGTAAEARTAIDPWGLPVSTGASEFNPWIVIQPDDTVIIRVTTPEIGNGVMTQCAMTVAEELGCAWSNVRAEFAPAQRNFVEKGVYSTKPIDYFAGRSTSRPRMQKLLQAGASARERLRTAAAQVWNVPVGEVEAKDSKLLHGKTGRTLRFGEVAARAAQTVLAAEPALKLEADWTFLGKAQPGKLNNSVIVNGTATFGIDVRLPNMLYAALVQSPVHGGRLKSYDFEAIRNMPGVRGVAVVDPDAARVPLAIPSPFPMGMAAAQAAIAVIADHYWQARTALEAMPILWRDGDGAQWKTTEQINEAVLKACEAPGKIEVAVGDAPKVLAGAKTIVEASYLTPYCEHAMIEPLNGTALYTPERLEIWHPSQNSEQAFCVAVEESGLPPEKVFVNQTYVGGGFGRRVMGHDVRLVVAIAKQMPGRPVQVIWSREETFRQGRYRALEAARLTAALDEKGMPKALLARIAGKGHYVNGMGNSVYASGTIPNVQVESTTVPLHVLTGAYRGPGYNSNAFILETFIDECAVAAKIDPLEYRLRLLANWGDEGWAKCLRDVAAQSGWGGTLPRGQGRGIAISNWGMDGSPKTGTTVAAVAHVEVANTGELKIHQIDLSFDSGKIINHDAVLSQLEGGAIFGLNMALNEGLTIQDGKIVEGNYDEYTMLRMPDIPLIRIHFDGLSGNDRFNEVGEPPVGPIGPAIVNAIYAATGKRIRRTPILKQDLSWS